MVSRTGMRPVWLVAHTSLMTTSLDAPPEGESTAAGEQLGPLPADLREPVLDVPGLAGEVLPQVGDELDRAGHVVLAVPDLTGDRDIGEDVVEEQVSEPQAAAELQTRRGRVGPRQLSKIRAQGGEPPVGFGGRRGGLIHPV